MTRTGIFPPETLATELAHHGVLTPEDDWTPLPDRRGIRLWRVDRSSAPPLTVKLYTVSEPDPLFADDPAVDAEILAHLAARQLAPRLVFRCSTPSGICLVHEDVPGAPQRRGTFLVARALHKLHAIEQPAGLRQAPDGSDELAEQTGAILSDCASPAASAARNLAPQGKVPPLQRPVLLHGDPVPDAMIVTETGFCWAGLGCAASGDPCTDLALFLSPAMQVLRGAAPLGRAERAAFLASYPCQQTVARYRALAPWYHWRMLAYCLWRHERGDALARHAVRAEETGLKQSQIA
ncbi:phosphotransferase family protein [Roseovarius sp.]|jgi:hypothetical protein